MKLQPAVIKKVGSGYAVFSHKTGKKLSSVGSLEQARKRLAQIRYFKFKGKK